MDLWLSIGAAVAAVLLLPYGVLHLVAIRRLRTADPARHPFLAALVEGDPVGDRRLNTLDAAESIAWAVALAAFGAKGLLDLGTTGKVVLSVVWLVGAATAVTLLVQQRRIKRAERVAAA